MKATYILTLLLIATPVMAQTGASADGTEQKSVDEAFSPNQKAFLNLPEESRKDFIKHLGEANRLFQQKRIFESLEELDKSSKIFADSAEIYNLRGSCYVEMRAFDKALSDFQKAASFVKDNPSIEFNIAEIYFCTKQWQKSVDMLQKVLKALTKENVALCRLVEFKILLCEKKLGKNAEAKALADKYDFQDDSPFYYYAQAALAYEAKDPVKAEEWLGIANRVFTDPQVIAPWQDTLVEYGYIKSFYGDDAVTDE